MHLTIVTPEKKLYDDEVSEVIVPTTNGHIAILPHHVNLLTQVAPGEMTIKAEKREHTLAITGGYLEINNNTINILADYAIRTEDIEVEKVLEAQKRAEEVLKKTRENVTERDFANAEAELRRSILQLDVANRRSKRPRI